MQRHSYGSAIIINGDIYTEVSVIITLDGCVWGNASSHRASGWRLWTCLCSGTLSYRHGPCCPQQQTKKTLQDPWILVGVVFFFSKVIIYELRRAKTATLTEMLVYCEVFRRGSGPDGPVAPAAAVNQRVALKSHSKVRLLMTAINQIERQDFWLEDVLLSQSLCRLAVKERRCLCWLARKDQPLPIHLLARCTEAGMASETWPSELELDIDLTISVCVYIHFYKITKLYCMSS